MPLFDSVDHLEAGNPQVNQYLATLSLGKVPDAGIVYELAVDWLLEQRHSENNYKTYRSELTTFLHWCFCEVAISPRDLTRRIMMRYLDYCQAPPSGLIAIKKGVKRPVTLVWGGRSRKGIYLPAAVERWKKLMPDFRFIPALQDADDARDLIGFNGRPDDAVRQNFPVLKGHEVYCCGSPAMVTAVRKVCVEERGLDPHHFFSDVFVPGPAAA